MTTGTCTVRQRLVALQDTVKAWVGMYSLIREPLGESPFLEVQNNQEPMRPQQRIFIADDSYVTGDGRKLSPVRDPDTAALAITMAMRRND